MRRMSCLAGLAADPVAAFDAILSEAGAPLPARVEPLDVRRLGGIAPYLLVCDVDRLETDPLEMLRRLRFVMPATVIAVFTATRGPGWTRKCHLAGANAVLSKRASATSLARALRQACRTGCFSDAAL